MRRIGIMSIMLLSSLLCPATLCFASDYAFTLDESGIPALAGERSAIVVISQDLDELLSLCDTLAVINGGRLSKPMQVAQADINEIGLLMGGIHGGTAATPEHADAH